MNDFLQSLRNGQAEKPRTPKTRKNSDNSYHYTSSPRFQPNGGHQNTRNTQMKNQSHQAMSYQGGNQMPAEDAKMTLLADILDNLSINVENMVSAQERTADILERQAIAIERILNHLNIAPETAPPIKQSDAEKVDTEKVDAQPAFENHYVTSRESKDTPNNLVQDTPTQMPGNEPQNRQGNKPENKIKEPVKKALAKKVQKIQDKPQIKKTITPSKPILRKRRKVTAKKAIEPVPNTTELMPRDAVMDIINSMRKEGATFDQVAHRLIELGQPTFSGRGEWHAQTIHRLCSKK